MGKIELVSPYVNLLSLSIKSMIQSSNFFVMCSFLKLGWLLIPRNLSYQIPNNLLRKLIITNFIFYVRYPITDHKYYGLCNE